MARPLAALSGTQTSLLSLRYYQVLFDNHHSVIDEATGMQRGSTSTAQRPGLEPESVRAQPCGCFRWTLLFPTVPSSPGSIPQLRAPVRLPLSQLHQAGARGMKTGWVQPPLPCSGPCPPGTSSPGNERIP